MLAGAILFLWQSHPLWGKAADEGYTFGDGASLFYLSWIFGLFANLFADAVTK